MSSSQKNPNTKFRKNLDFKFEQMINILKIKDDDGIKIKIVNPIPCNKEQNKRKQANTPTNNRTQSNPPRPSNNRFNN